MSRRRSKFRWGLAAAAGLVVISTGVWLTLRLTGRPPTPVPDIQLDDVEPAVRDLITTTRRGVLAHPRSADAWGKLGMAMTANAFYAQGAASFAEAERLAPKDPRWPYLRARSLQEESADAALPDLRRAADLAPQSVPAPALTLAEYFLRQNGPADLSEAGRLLDRVLRRDPQDARALLDRARLANIQGDLQLAERLLNRALEVAPGNKPAHVLLAGVQQRLNQPAAAEKTLRAADGLPEGSSWQDPYTSELLQYRVGQKADFDRARHLLAANSNAELLDAAEALTRKYPQNFEGWDFYGVALARVGRVPESEVALRNAVRLAPDSYRARVDLIVALGLEGHYDAVQSACRELIARRPEAAEPHFFLGAAAAREGNWDAALSELRAAVRLRPDSAKYRVALGEGLVKSGHAADAIPELRQVLALEPNNATALRLLKQIQVLVPQTPP